MIVRFSAHISKWELVCKFGEIFHIFIISCLCSRFHAWNQWFFLLSNNLFIYQVPCTLISRRRSLYSFLWATLLQMEIDTLKLWCVYNVINLLEICKDTPAGMVKHISLYSTGVMIFSANNIPSLTSVFYGPLTRYVQLRVVHVRGMPRTFPRHQLQRKPLVSDPDMHRCRWDR